MTGYERRATKRLVFRSMILNDGDKYDPEFTAPHTHTHTHTHTHYTRYTVLQFISMQSPMQRKCTEYICLVSFVVIITLMLYYLVRPTLEYHVSQLWATLVLIAITQQAIIIKPLELYFMHVWLLGDAAKRARLLCHILYTRSSLIFHRTGGVMKRYDDFIHHFNPVCRAARMHAGLPVARLLLSLNEADVPV